MVNLTKYEQELIINLNNDDKVATVYSSNPYWLRRLQHLAEEHPNDVKLVHKDTTSETYEVPKKWVKIQPKRFVSEEQRLAARERFAKMREQKEELTSESSEVTEEEKEN